MYLDQAAANVDLAAYTIGTGLLNNQEFLVDQLEQYQTEKTDTSGCIKWFSKANLDEAKYWLKKVVHGECEHKILGEADMLDAQEKLKEIEEEHEKSNGE